VVRSLPAAMSCRTAIRAGHAGPPALPRVPPRDDDEEFARSDSLDFKRTSIMPVADGSPRLLISERGMFSSQRPIAPEMKPSISPYVGLLQISGVMGAAPEPLKQLSSRMARRFWERFSMTGFPVSTAMVTTRSITTGTPNITTSRKTDWLLF